MLYVSSKNGDKIGVTDTDDNVEEIYTKEQLARAFRVLGLRINGFIYTGSDFRIEVKNIPLINMERIQNMGIFYLNNTLSIKIGETTLRDFNIFDGNKYTTIKRKDLLSGKYRVSSLVGDNVNIIALVKKAIKCSKSMTTVYRLESEYKIY